jgi:phospholipid-binding lipoprotein MlaA
MGRDPILCWARRAARMLVVLALAALTGACATIPPNAGNDPKDPFEVYNRHMAEFNQGFDKAITKPIAQGYVDYIPEPVRSCVGNMLSNILELPNVVNNVLQGKPEAVGNFCRFFVNSTAGVLGCFDVAKKLECEKNDSDFGLTLGHWGFGPGPYFVWPILGPSSIRDSVGRIANLTVLNPVRFIDDTGVRNTIYGTAVIDLRASLLPADKVVDQAALDRYLFIRDGYLQRRRNLVYDGNPPREKDPDDEDEKPDQPKPAPVR